MQKTLFNLKSPYEPKGDQPRAIERLTSLLGTGNRHQTLLGVTGSGKTFTMANVIKNISKPTLVLSPNKTLALQLYQEFKEFFPENAVHYFVSYYDYYQPEAYLPATDTYIEKDAKINDFIDQLRHASTASLLTRRDIIIIASVSAIYGIGDPEEYSAQAFEAKKGERITRKEFLRKLADLQYQRNDIERLHGTYRVKGEMVEIISPDGSFVTKVEFFGDTIENISGGKVKIFPAKHFMTKETQLKSALQNIKEELNMRLQELRREGKILEAERLKKRTLFDIAMLRETGYTAGIENYSRHLSFRAPGSPPFTLLDYFPADFLTFIDESHITVPQVRGMYHGDRARKQVLVEHGFRLPSALDNRPLTFDEFEEGIQQVVFVSATPGEYELKRNHVVEQLVRPTGLLDPMIEVRPTRDQMKNAIKEIIAAASKRERTLLLCLTKRNAEDITEYLLRKRIKAGWLHSEMKTLERPEILKNLREGKLDVIVGINLLREGLDLPEVALICVLDADKEGFLRNVTTLIQTAGRASRHLKGRVIFYGDTITGSMKNAIEETARRRMYQSKFNEKYNIVPMPIQKEIRGHPFVISKKASPAELARELKQGKRSVIELKKELEAEMFEEASNLNFERAAELRDILKNLK